MKSMIEPHTIEKSLAEIESELKGLDKSSARRIRENLENIRKQLKSTIHLVIDNFGGVLQEVDAFRTSEQAEKHFQTVTGFAYEAVCEWEKADRSYDLGLSHCDEFDTQIWEVEIKGDPR